MKRKIELKIEACYGDLRPSEKRAADYILEHMEEVKTLPLDRLAERCQVSQPTVMRMIKALGFGGYREFRYAVVEEFAQSNGRGDAEKISPKIFCQVIEMLNQAGRIDIYSVENSNVTAQDLLTKLLYLGLDCRHFDDTYHQRICAGNLKKGDVAIGVSYSGNSRDTVEAVKAARKAGASTIVITNFRDSLITRYADLLLCTSQDQFFYGDAIFSRTTQLLIVDMIYMGLLTSDYNRYVKVLNRNSQIVQDKAYP